MTYNNSNLQDWLNYSCLDILEYIYLEDSYVIDIIKEEYKVLLLVEFVLMKQHPLYRQPGLNEHHCYHKGNILFNDILSINKFIIKPVENIDITGEIDWGNIDTFLYKKNRYLLVGEWGELDITANRIEVNYSRP